jgi:RNA polymerase sigma factor (sigma-70 family)
VQLWSSEFVSPILRRHFRATFSIASPDSSTTLGFMSCSEEFNAPELRDAQFTTTHWSLVAAAADREAPEVTLALEQLCRTYWPPVYGFVRRRYANPEDARDLTQGFFNYLLEQKSLAKADRTRGKFRSFLLGSLKHFLAHERERSHALKRGGEHVFVSIDSAVEEGRFDPSHNATPEALFDQRWALQQIDRAVDRLASHYSAAGRGPLFELLQDYVWGDKSTATLAEIASQLELTEEAVKKAVQRLRARFRDCLRAEVAQTVTSPDQIDDELRHLRTALRERV